MSFMLLGILNAQAAGGGLAYWIATLGGASNDTGYGAITDSAGNAYTVGLTLSSGAGSGDLLLAKYDTQGAVQWQRTLGGTGFDQGFSVAIDSSDNVYAVGETDPGAGGRRDFLIAKYNSSGTIQWQRTLGGSTDESALSVAIDSSDNVYVIGASDLGGFSTLYLAKYNSSGNIQWQRTLSGSSNDEGFSVAIDSSDNVYVSGQTRSEGAGFTDFLVAKYNSSGTIQWQRILGGSSSEFTGFVAIDSSDNVYLLGYTFSAGAGSTDFLIAKYNSSGTIQWQRILGGSAREESKSIAIDSLDNIYLLGETPSEGEGGTDFLIAKYNSSGTIQWQRILGGSSNDKGYSVAIDSLDDVYILGGTFSTGEGGNDFLVAKIPNDGSLTGTYELDGVNIVYAASTLTAATSTFTAATSTLTSASASLTAATSTLTDSSASLTSHIVGL